MISLLLRLDSYCPHPNYDLFPPQSGQLVTPPKLWHVSPSVWIASVHTQTMVSLPSVQIVIVKTKLWPYSSWIQPLLPHKSAYCTKHMKIRSPYCSLLVFSVSSQSLHRHLTSEAAHQNTLFCHLYCLLENSVFQLLQLWYNFFKAFIVASSVLWHSLLWWCSIDCL